MSSRYRPNEPAVPISMDLIALMLRADEERVISIAADMQPLQRASAAVFCVGRCHLRHLGLLIASQCTEHALWEVAGAAGVTLFHQSRAPESFDTPFNKRSRVTLARSA